MSTNAAGEQADQGVDSMYPAAWWSPDSTRIVFSSYATNLVEGGHDGNGHIFIKTLPL